MKWFSFFLALSIGAFAQEEVYYKSIHKNDLAIRTSISNSVLSLDIDTLTYLPNTTNTLNFGVSHPKLPFEIGFGFSLPENRKSNDHPRTKRLDLQLHKYENKYVLDLFFQDYKGFYTKDLEFIEVNHPNLSMLMIGAFGQYIFNDKFSYAASFGKNKKQLKSAGTFLAGANVYYFKLKSDKKNIKNQKDITMKLFGLNGGYSLNYPFSENWVTNISLNIGFNFTDDFSLKRSSLARISLYHVGKKSTYGISGVANNLYLKNIDKVGTDKVNSGQVNFDFIYHFKLKKKK